MKKITNITNILIEIVLFVSINFCAVLKFLDSDNNFLDWTVLNILALINLIIAHQVFFTSKVTVKPA